VVEVRCDHMEGVRFRHTAQFERRRPDRTPQSCTFAQLDRPLSYELGDIVPGLGPVGPGRLRHVDRRRPVRALLCGKTRHANGEGVPVDDPVRPVERTEFAAA